ncbi:hypothetical protein H4R19_005351, partial [Coemansia spiralis]
MDDSAYDEFGNYIGPELATSSEEEDEESDVEVAADAAGVPATAGDGSDAEASDDDDNSGGDGRLIAMTRRLEVSQTQIVLHEDKQYYPDAEDVFGPDVEVLVQEEDTQPLTVPIVPRATTRRFEVAAEQDLPDSTYTKEFLVDLLGYPEMVRNIAVAGHLHHGKTALVDVLVAATHAWPEWDREVPIATPTTKMPRPSEKAFGYTDVLQLERQRGVSLKAMPVSLVAQTTRGKSYALNILDTPGHVNFVDEVIASVRMADGLVLVVDAVEGVMASTERAVRAAVREGLSITLVVNKVDRLIVELKLPPADA